MNIFQKAKQERPNKHQALNELTKIRKNWRRKKRAFRQFQCDALQSIYTQTLTLWRDKAERSSFLTAIGQPPSDNGPPFDDLLRLATEYCESTSSKKVAQKHARALLSLHEDNVKPSEISDKLKNRIERLARSRAATNNLKRQRPNASKTVRLPISAEIETSLSKKGAVKVSLVLESDKEGRPVVRAHSVSEILAQSQLETEFVEW
jgi:hypothetical protein